MTISIKEVEHVAKLARLALSDEEKKLYTEQLGKIIAFFDQLKAIDTTGLEPLAHPLPLVNVLREDETHKPLGHDILLENAPDKEKAYFRVPKIGE